jgi:diadenosine tetraphosphate (Ap4A) HIT family hydrolase
MKKVEGIETDGTRGEGNVECPFCDEKRLADAPAVREKVFAVDDLFPVTKGHLLIIPRRHTPDFFSMTEEEKAGAFDLIDDLRLRIQSADPEVTGFNVGANCGEAAGQTVMHAHIHLIPRRHGDTQDPRGGVRGVIPEKRNYLVGG